MKKSFISALALLLLVAMLIPSLVACNVDSGDGSDASSDASGNASGEESQIQELIPVENPEFSTVVSVGATYNSTVDSSSEYDDTYGIELTDGQLAPEGISDYSSSVFAGYSGSASITLTVDLGANVDKIYEFRVGYYSTANSGAKTPDSIKVMIAPEGAKYETIGNMEIPEPAESARQEATFRLEHYRTARFVRFVIARPSGWLFLDEVQVIADVEGNAISDTAFADLIKDAYAELGVVEYEGTTIPNETLPYELISKGCEYTASDKNIKGFIDRGYLTDGIITGSYQNGQWVGFEGSQKIEIVVDLGKVRDDISCFKTPIYANQLTGTFMPVAVTYAVSEDNESFTDVGRVFGVSSTQPTYDFPLYLNKCAKGRYVRITLENTPSERFLIEETAVYAKNEATGGDSYYPALRFDKNEKNWESPSNETVNLISGLTQQIYIPKHASGIDVEKLPPVNTTLLTDGKKTKSNDIHNGYYYKLSSTSAPIDFYYDLTATSAVKSFTIEFTHRPDWGVNAPNSLMVYVSDDANTWYAAGSINIDISKEAVVTGTLNLPRAVNARYVCFSMLTVQWVGISEIEVFGSKSANGTKLADSGLVDKENSSKGFFAPDKNILNGYSDLCLLYHKADTDGYNADTLLNYVAYVDTEGKVKDTMFDSFLFLISGKFPSGLATTVDHTKSDIEWVVEDLFTEGENILALEEAAGKAKAELNLGDDFKYGFTVSLYKPNSSRKNYGDINGDGVSDDLTNDANRLLEIEWQMKLFEAKLAQYNFKNIEFIGYYWFNEGVYPEDNEAYLVQETSKLVHKRGVDFFWIPWFCAPGVPDWKENGFDVACMQPNYVFDETVLPGRLEQSIDILRTYGMGIEIEIDNTALRNETLYNRYLEYISKGAKYNYMKNCVHMYYQEINTYYVASTAADSKTRYIYDATYQFIKGTLPAYPDALETVKINGEKGKITEGKVTEQVPMNANFNLVSMPESGTVSINNNGEFMYFPAKDFTGTVTFGYIYDTGLGESDVCYVEITIE